MRELNTAMILRVGDGRGFLIKHSHRVLVVTAAHCLPSLPPAHPAQYLEERTYARLLGPLGEEPAVAAECLFVDPIADVAVLGEPDSQALPEEWEQFEALVHDRPTLHVGSLTETCPGRVLPLHGCWEGCVVSPVGSLRTVLSIDGAVQEATAPGTSGSPILVGGRAVGVVSTGSMFNPCLENTLPGWLIREYAVNAVNAER